jgi:spore coat protein U-like protein
MTPVRTVLIATAAVGLLAGARPMAGDDQFPRGLMSSAEPRAARVCGIETRPLSFGTYDPLADAPLDAIGQIIYVCANSVAAGTTAQDADKKSIRIEIARGFSSAYSVRQMLGPDVNGLEYNIYLDATHRTIWGDGTSGTDYYFDAKPPNNTPVVVPAFGRIPARQQVEAGAYADAPAVRILF